MESKEIKKVLGEENICDLLDLEAQLFNVWDPGCWLKVICMCDRDKIVANGLKEIP